MRNKALLGLAALAVTAATCVAQSNVYSLNIVGYINVTAKPGYNLVANQLKAGGNTLNEVLTNNIPAESLVLKYVSGAYVSDIFLDGSWFNATSGDPSTTKVTPGEGFFFFNPDAADKTLTLVGEVTTGTGLTVTNKPLYNLVSSIVPQAIALTAANGFPQVDETLYLTYQNPPGNYNQSINLGGEWLNSVTGDPAPAIPQVGQGFFIFNPGTQNMLWTRDFNP